MKLCPGSTACRDDNFMIDAYRVGGALLRVNMISSTDGAATLDGRSGPLGGPADQALMNTLRTLADVVLVGAGTVRAEGYRGDLVDARAQRWRQAQGMPARPGLAVVSRSGRVPTQLAADCYPSAAAALAGLAAAGRRHVLCEGGPALLGTLLALDAVDELCLTVGPVLAGPAAGRIVAGRPLEAVRRMRLIHAIPSDDLLFLRYTRAPVVAGGVGS